MLLIDKDKDYNDIIVNTQDRVGYGDYEIVLYSQFSNKEFKFNLYSDISEHPERYNQFRISTLQFEKIADGDYIYTIIQNDVEHEKGLMKVLSFSQPNIYIDPIDNDDDFTVYEG